MWDATCADTLAPSHQAMAARESRAVAVDAEQRKKSKYSHLETTHCFVPVAVKTLGAMGPEARSFFRELPTASSHHAMRRGLTISFCSV